MTDEIVVRQIDVVLTKLSLQPGDVLVVSVPQRLRDESAVNMRKAFEQSFGVPALILQDGMKLDAVLSVSPECLEYAAEIRAKAAEAFRERMEKMLEDKA